MGRPYSQDLRKRVVKTVLSGKSCRATAKLYDLSASSVIRWVSRYQKTNSFASGQMGGHKVCKLASLDSYLVDYIKRTPDFTIADLLYHIEDTHQIRVGRETLRSYLKRMGYSFKKNHFCK